MREGEGVKTKGTESNRTCPGINSFCKYGLWIMQFGAGKILIPRPPINQIRSLKTQQISDPGTSHHRSWPDCETHTRSPIASFRVSDSFSFPFLSFLTCHSRDAYLIPPCVFPRSPFPHFASPSSPPPSSSLPHSFPGFHFVLELSANSFGFREHEREFTPQEQANCVPVIQWTSATGL